MLSIIPNGTASMSSHVLKHVSNKCINQVTLSWSVNEVGRNERELSKRNRERERERERETDRQTDRQTGLIISGRTELSTPYTYTYKYIRILDLYRLKIANGTEEIIF